MVKDPKITIRLFLQYRLKSKIAANGEECFPLYARVIFLRKGTQLPILTQKGEQIYLSQPDFDFLIKEEQIWAKEGRFFFKDWQRIVFSKEIILHNSVQKMYEKDRGRIDWKDVVDLYRWHEKYVYVIAFQRAKKVQEKLIGGIDQAAAEFTEEDRRVMESFVVISAYTAFTTNKLTWSLSKGKEKIAGIPSSSLGTVYHWIFEEGKQEFGAYLKQWVNDMQQLNHHANSGGISWEFIKMFPVRKERADEYVQSIDSMIQMIGPKKMLYQD